ncbi:hypothetical protein CFAM422_002833 [Trichoderma lentiforme]|uniref:Uncharacterized protein n=1 Tax=Trichoderma lentiforme TaxID=1567552 RepID=A0A9P4XKP8_9HYPO|nr:hypothetical protein CFAM422_002833 [Trichoderma lentiforme]
MGFRAVFSRRTTGSSREPRDKGAFLLYPLQKTDQRCSTLGSIHATLSGMPVSLVGFGRIADGSSVLSSSATSDLVKPRHYQLPTRPNPADPARQTNGPGVLAT